MSEVGASEVSRRPVAVGTSVPLKDSRQKLLHLQRLRGQEPTWVECVKCLKWRLLNDVTDPSQLPSDWCCQMNTDPSHNSCDSVEERCSEEDSERMVFNKYAAGSLVWAKLAGYPWWPAMVDDDPDYKEFFWIERQGCLTPTHYHVVFLDETVSRAWIPVKMLRSYTDATTVASMAPFVHRGRNYRPRVELAAETANHALPMTIKDRLRKYSFVTRYTGPWGKVGAKVKRDCNKKKGTRKKDEGTIDSSVTANTVPFVKPDVPKSLKKQSSKPETKKTPIAGEEEEEGDEAAVDRQVAASFSQESYEDVLRDAASLIATWSDLSDEEEEEEGLLSDQPDDKDEDDDRSECSITREVTVAGARAKVTSKKRKVTSRDPDYLCDQPEDGGDVEATTTSTSGHKKKKKSGERAGDGAAVAKKTATEAKDSAKVATTGSPASLKRRKKPQFGVEAAKKNHQMATDLVKVTVERNQPLTTDKVKERNQSGRVKPVFVVKRVASDSGSSSVSDSRNQIRPLEE